jgi:hypothetical protein
MMMAGLPAERTSNKKIASKSMLSEVGKLNSIGIFVVFVTVTADTNKFWMNDGELFTT